MTKGSDFMSSGCHAAATCLLSVLLHVNVHVNKMLTYSNFYGSALRTINLRSTQTIWWCFYVVSHLLALPRINQGIKIVYKNMLGQVFQGYMPLDPTIPNQTLCFISMTKQHQNNLFRSPQQHRSRQFQGPKNLVLVHHSSGPVSAETTPNCNNDEW